MTVGKVWLVGAGPGDIGLFTLKGMKVLKEAEVVVYDSLVGQGVLSMIPRTAHAINVGKRAGNHTMPQEQINQVLLEQAQAGYRVVRLKGGDPFLFGRGGEELTLLKENHIPYEVIPGVTSPLSVPAYNGIPVTHRDFCSSLHIITGHKKAGMEYNIDFGALVHTKGTLVFLMGVTALADICTGLLKGGMDPDMPAAILQKGTTAGQKRIVATVSTLKSEVDRRGIETPAIIVVGKVCALSEEFAWYEELPLSGYKVLVTRPRELISSMAEKLREKGAEVLELPAIATVPIEDSEPLKKAFDKLSDYQWIVFTSPTGVRIFFDKLRQMELDIRRLGTCKVAAIGEGTRKALKERGIMVDFMPEVYHGEALGAGLAQICSPGCQILIPRAKEGNQSLVNNLEQAGAVVDDIPTYTTIYETQEIIDETSEFQEGTIDCAVFTSASTVKGFAESVKGLDFSKVKAACIGRQTREAAEVYGMQTQTADKATMDSLVELVIRMKEEQND